MVQTDTTYCGLENISTRLLLAIGGIRRSVRAVCCCRGFGAPTPVFILLRVRLQTPHEPIPQHGVLAVVALGVPVVDVVISNLVKREENIKTV